MRFLEREVYTFAGSRRNAVGPHFFVYGRAAGASDGPAADGSLAARARNRGQSNTKRSGV